MKYAIGNFITRSTAIERLARDPFAVAVLTGIVVWFGLGFVLGFAVNLDALEGVLCAAVTALTLGCVRGAAGGMLAREHIENRWFRLDVHNHPFLYALPMQVIGFLPYPVLLYADGIITDGTVFAVAAVTGSLLCAAVGAWGHHTDSRGWDVFWHGGGFTGLAASMLDNAVHGPSPIDA